MGLKFPSWPSKSSRIDTIHRKIVSSVNRIGLSMCFTVGSIVTMTISYPFQSVCQSVVLFASFVRAEFLAKDQRNPTTDDLDLGPLDQMY